MNSLQKAKTPGHRVDVLTLKEKIHIKKEIDFLQSIQKYRFSVEKL